MVFLKKLFAKIKEPQEKAAAKPSNPFESALWQVVKTEHSLTADPFPACPVDCRRDVMWLQEDTLFFAPKRLESMDQIEAYSLESIESFFVNPKDHNEIRIKLLAPYKPQGSGKPLKFYSNSLVHFRSLIPEKEYRFSSKTMQLGKQRCAGSAIKLGNLKDVRSGGEFEEYLTTLFWALGYRAENTKMSRDQGIDVMVSKGGKKYGIQAKYYSQPVGNSAVQEVIAGREYFKLDKAAVITNATFTSAAVDLALRTNVRLIDGEELNRLIQRAKAGRTTDLFL